MTSTETIFIEVKLVGYALSYRGRHFRSSLVMMKKGLDKFEREVMWNMYYNVTVLIDGRKWKLKKLRVFSVLQWTLFLFTYLQPSGSRFVVFCVCVCVLMI